MPSTVVGCTKSNDRNFNPKAQFGRDSVVCTKPTTTPAALVSVTFRVNMQKTKTEASGVYVAGPVFNSPTGQKMSDADRDGIYELTVSLVANKQYYFKFRNGKHDA